MKPIRETKDAVVLRTDFSDSATWDAICAAAVKPQGDFRAYVEFVSDREYEGVTPEQLIPLASEVVYRAFIFVVDGVTINHDEYPILVVDLLHEPGRSFRVIPAEMWSVENNLSIANMDFEDFADATDDDGIFRGFREA